MKNKLRWLYPGIGIKRWVFLCCLGILLMAISSASLVKSPGWEQRIYPLVGLILGTLIIFIGMKEMFTSVVNTLHPQRSKDLVEIFLEKKMLGKGPNIVAVGGGTGLSTLLQGLKKITTNTTAIVTVADDGGSSGRLRKEFDTLPPGDIRNCLVALADAEPLMRELFQYRFKGEGELKGHNFGNLFITALTQITGDFEKAIKESSKVLAIKGRVVPATVEKVKLVAEHVDGRKTIGESKIPEVRTKIARVYLDPQSCKPCYEAVEAISSADAIVFGPGSLYTSILPNLLVPGILNAILNSSGIKIYVCNIMTECGETDNYKASDHVQALIDHTSPQILDYCIINSSFIPDELLKKYREEFASPVEPDAYNIEKMGYKCIVRDLARLGDVVRHDPDKLANLILEIIGKEKGKGRWI